MGHAIHALLLYDERVFQPYDGEEESRQEAGSPSNGQALVNVVALSQQPTSSD